MKIAYHRLILNLAAAVCITTFSNCSFFDDNHIFDNQIVVDVTPGSFQKDSMAVFDIMNSNGIPSSHFDSIIGVNSFGRITSVNLGSMNIKVIPESFCHLYALKSAYLDSNLIERLPDSIGNLQMLEYFDISDNLLRTLPESILQIDYIGYSYHINDSQIEYVYQLYVTRNYLKNLSPEMAAWLTKHDRNWKLTQKN